MVLSVLEKKNMALLFNLTEASGAAKWLVPKVPLQCEYLGLVELGTSFVRMLVFWFVGCEMLSFLPLPGVECPMVTPTAPECGRVGGIHGFRFVPRMEGTWVCRWWLMYHVPTTWGLHTCYG
jgi:hypothetical protein